MENDAVVKALAVAFIATVLEDHAGELTQEETERATKAAYVVCKDMEDAKVQISAYELFLQALKFLEE